MGLDRRGTGNQNRRCTVANLAGVAGGDHAALFQRLHAGQRLHRGVGTDAFIRPVNFTILKLKGHDLLVECTRFGRLCRALMAQQSKGIKILAAEVMLACNRFGRKTG